MPPLMQLYPLLILGQPSATCANKEEMLASYFVINLMQCYCGSKRGDTLVVHGRLGHIFATTNTLFIYTARVFYSDQLARCDTKDHKTKTCSCRSAFYEKI